MLKLLRAKGIEFNEESDTEDLFKLLISHSFDEMGDVNGKRQDNRIIE